MKDKKLGGGMVWCVNKVKERRFALDWINMNAL